MIPVVDIFAGPGGLAEGFSSINAGGQRLFDIRLSVEKETDPFETLRLRAFFRQSLPDVIPDDYYRLLRGEIGLEDLYRIWPEQARKAAEETWQAVIGEHTQDELDRHITNAIGISKNWVLIGGPPCQAYSSAGIVGNRTKQDYKPENDRRYYLYREYIRCLAVHAPAAFVMENVPGMLAAKLNGCSIINDVLRGLAMPGEFVFREFDLWMDAPAYKLMSLTSGPQGIGEDPKKFLVRTETLGLPQARHRIIVVGIREDLDPASFLLPPTSSGIPLEEVLDDLPRVRSTLSKERDSIDAWRSVLTYIPHEPWLDEVEQLHGQHLKQCILEAVLDAAGSSPVDCGSGFIPWERFPSWNTEWFADTKLRGVIHHQARPHIRRDLHRYLFCVCFSNVLGRSPKLPEFPPSLLPEHRNALSGDFRDRFRTLVRGRPSGTIISHLAKDGHAFIHPDPIQCRSITPREAARLQTFPDNYYFFGGRSSQFKQIGNAVPPWFARIIAIALYPVLSGRNGLH